MSLDRLFESLIGVVYIAGLIALLFLGGLFVTLVSRVLIGMIMG